MVLETHAAPSTKPERMPLAREAALHVNAHLDLLYLVVELAPGGCVHAICLADHAKTWNKLQLLTASDSSVASTANTVEQNKRLGCRSLQGAGHVLLVLLVLLGGLSFETQHRPVPYS